MDWVLCHINLFGLVGPGEGTHCARLRRALGPYGPWGASRPLPWVFPHVHCQIKYLVYVRYKLYINLFSELYSGFISQGVCHINLFGLGEGIHCTLPNKIFGLCSIQTLYQLIFEDYTVDWGYKRSELPYNLFGLRVGNTLCSRLRRALGPYGPSCAPKGRTHNDSFINILLISRYDSYIKY